MRSYGSQQAGKTCGFRLVGCLRRHHRQCFELTFFTESGLRLHRIHVIVGMLDHPSQNVTVHVGQLIDVEARFADLVFA